VGTVSTEIKRPIAEVWHALIDAERYPEWLIGAQTVEVPAEWPRPGASFSHRIGIGPLRLPGSTTSREVIELERFRLGAGMGVLGECQVTFELEPAGPDRTRVTVQESPVSGTIDLVDHVAHPLVDRGLDGRNGGSLDRLRRLLEPVEPATGA
jgi:carbon monoxide dehydrogenase subunit G